VAAAAAAAAGSSEVSPAEVAFLLGLRGRVPELPLAFFEPFYAATGRSVSQRLWYLLQNSAWWEQIAANCYWIGHAADLLLAASSASASASALSSAADLLSAPDSVLVVGPLRELLFHDAQLAHETWLQLFPTLWGCLSGEEQARSGRAFGQLLAREPSAQQLARQAQERPNAMQSLLEAAALCSPPLRVSPDVARYGARRFGNWHASAALLDAQLQRAAPAERDEKLWEALLDVYAGLGERDLHASTWVRRASLDETRAALQFEQFGLWQRAQEMYYATMTRAQAAQTAPRAEASLWQEHWIAAARRLQQWEVLGDFARTYNHSELLLECAWKQSDWQGMREAVQKTAHLPETSLSKLQQCYLALQEGRWGEVLPPAAEHPHPDSPAVAAAAAGADGALSQTGLVLALREWARLPRLPSASHLQLLHQMQLLVEVQESAAILRELAAAASRAAALLQAQQTPQQQQQQQQQQSLLEVKAALSAWRERLPALTEDLLWWDELLQWRQQVFGKVSEALVSMPAAAEQNMGYHESAFTLARLSHAQRRHLALDVALSNLQRIYAMPSIQMTDAFQKLKQQAKCYLALPTAAGGQPAQHQRSGLEAINSTNLDYFSLDQRAELFRYKARFLQLLRQQDDAFRAYSTAASLCDHLAGTWLDWGRFCEEAPALSPPVPPASWPELALQCYLQAARAAASSPGSKRRRALARILHLTHTSDDLPVTASALEQQLAEAPVPAHAWLPFLPLLLDACVSRHGPRHAPDAARLWRTVLQRIAQQYPQAILWSLRSYAEEWRDAGGLVPPELDELLNAARAAAPEAAALESLARDLHQALCESPPPPPPPASSEDFAAACGRLALELLACPAAVPDVPLEAKLRSLLERAPADLAAELRQAPQDPSRLARALRNWQRRHEPRRSGWRPLPPGLLAVGPAAGLELPGQYAVEVGEVVPELHLRIERLHPRVRLLTSGPFGRRAVAFLASDGRLHWFTAQQLPTAAEMRQEARLALLLDAANRALDRHPASRQRRARLLAPFGLPLSHQCRLLQLGGALDRQAELPPTWSASAVGTPEPTPAFSSLQEACEEQALALGLDPDEPLLRYRESLLQAGSASAAEARAAAFQEAARQCPDHLLARHVAARLPPDQGQLFAWRQQFATSLAAYSLLAHVLDSRERRPDCVAFSLRSGRALLTGIAAPASATSSSADGDSAPLGVPFRLGRNVAALLGPALLEGTFTPVLLATALAFADLRDELRDLLAVWTREELLARAPVPLSRAQLRDHIQAYLAEVLDRRLSALLAPVPPPTLQNAGGVSSPAELKRFVAQPLLSRVAELRDHAIDPARLASLDAALLPWL
jgi:hypothetical protein